jgi:hypothetical protein
MKKGDGAMTPNKNQRKLGDWVKEITAVFGLMIAIFTVLEIFLPTSFAQPLGALVSGLVLTALLACVGKWDWGTMLITWLAVGIGLIILYLIVSCPATVVGAVVDSSGSPVVGLTLVLTDSDGVDHKAVTDENGAFEIKNIPEGKFTVLANGELLISKRVPSGWKRIIDSKTEVGAIVHRPGPTATAAPTVVAAVTPNTPTATPVVPTDTPSLPATPTARPTPTATPTNTPALTPTPIATPTNTPALTPTPIATPEPIAPVVCPRVSVGSRSPQTVIQGVSYSLNGGPPQVASNEEVLIVRPGDTISLVDLRYCSDAAGSSWDKVQGEAYLRKNGAFAYDDGRFTTGAPIQAGEHPIGAFGDSWTIQPGWDRLVIALVHYYQGGHEVDDRFFVNLVVQ